VKFERIDGASAVGFAAMTNEMNMESVVRFFGKAYAAIANAKPEVTGLDFKQNAGRIAPSRAYSC